MIALPKSAAESAALLHGRPDAVVRAGGTDLQDLRERGLRRGPTVDLRDTDGLSAVEAHGGGVRVGARVRLAELAEHPWIRGAWPGLAQAAGGLATPQVRAVATVAGSLLQDVRCWYYRDPAASCLKKGGSACLARGGDASRHACWDLGACIAPHPSTLGMALLALDALVEVEGGPARTFAAFLGDGADPRRTHTLPAGTLVTGFVLPAPAVGSFSAYKRTTQRARAEWPLVEGFVQVEVEGGRMVRPRVAVGGVANRPVRLGEVEAALAGVAVDGELRAALGAMDSRAVLPGSEWRARLVVPTLLDTLTAALAATPSAALPAPPEPPAAPEPPPPTPPRGRR